MNKRKKLMEASPRPALSISAPQVWQVPATGLANQAVGFGVSASWVWSFRAAGLANQAVGFGISAPQVWQVGRLGLVLRPPHDVEDLKLF